MMQSISEYMQKRHQYWKLDNANKVDEISRAKLISFISTPETSCTCPKLGFIVNTFVLTKLEMHMFNNMR